VRKKCFVSFGYVLHGGRLNSTCLSRRIVLSALDLQTPPGFSACCRRAYCVSAGLGLVGPKEWQKTMEIKALG
jgi:hypothetical protein